MGRYKEKFPPFFTVRLHFFIHNSLTLSHPEQPKRNGQWELWSAHSSFSLSPSSHSLLLHELLSTGAAPSRSLLQWGFFTELQGICFLQGISIFQSMGSSTGCSGISAPSSSSMGCRGQPASLQLLQGLQEYLSSGTWNTSFPPSLSTWVSVRWFLTLLFFSLSVPSLTLPWSILLFLQCFLKASPAPVLELLGMSSMGQPLAFPHPDQHCTSPLYCKLLDSNAQYKIWHLLPEKQKIVSN